MTMSKQPEPLNSSRKYLIAADARLGRTSYVDDQTWVLNAGERDEIALALQTRYGKRASLISIVPIIHSEDQQIYQALTYEQAPVVTLHTSNYLCLDALPKPEIRLSAEYWVMASNAVGMIFTFTNLTRKRLSLRLDLYAHVIVGGKEQRVGIHPAGGGGKPHALLLGQIANLQPCVIIEKGQADASGSSRVGVMVELKPGSSASVRAVHAGLRDAQSGYTYGIQWLKEDWNSHLKIARQAALAIPHIQTENADWDLTLNSAYRRVAQAFLRPTGQFPRTTFVASRSTDEGYSPRGDGSDHPRAWSGQDAHLAYLLMPSVCSIDAESAEGILLNYMAVQQPDGVIDMRPGPAGQRIGLHIPPLLARGVWQIYSQTQNKAWLKRVYPALIKALEYWFSPALDHDQDGIPEWQDDRQIGYPAFPAFAPGQSWSQGASANMVEGPGLISLLLSEIEHLQLISEALGMRKAVSSLLQHQGTLSDALQSMWNNEHFAYRDRDTHLSSTSQNLLTDAVADQQHFINQELNTPSRIVIRVIGGVNLVPQGKIRISGLGPNQESIEELVETAKFIWQGRQGTFTTRHVFQHVKSIVTEGLSRVYRVSLNALDCHRKDINTLLPLLTNDISEEIIRKLVKLSSDTNEFLRPNGITMVAASDPAFDSSNANGGGGIWTFWMGLVLEGLLRHGARRVAADAFKRLLTAQAGVLKETSTFWQFYHSDASVGSGERDHLAGIPPLHVFQRLIGIAITSPSRVWIDSEFAWGNAVVIRQHGVLIRRTTRSVRIRFPSGKQVDLNDRIEPQWLVDNGGKSAPSLPVLNIPDPMPTPPTPEPVPKRVKIDVKVEE